MHAKTFYGTAFTNASVVLLARVVGDYSEVLKRKDVLSGSYSASLIDPVFPDRSTPVEGHQNVPLDLNSVFFDSLQIDSSWDADALGYTPSAISQLITALEKELGLKLLIRSQKGVKSITLDGQPVEGTIIPYSTGKHIVEVTM